MTALRQIWVLLWKDLMIDLRRKENIIAMFFFSLLTLMVFRFALGEDSEPRYRLSPRVMAVQALREVPGEIRQDLENLSGRMFTGREALLDALNKLPSGPAPGAVRIAILENARTSTLSESAAGLLWVTVLLAGVLGLSRSFTQEKEHGCMDGLLLTPVSRGVLYLGKMLSNALFLVLILVLLMPLFALFFQVGLGGILGPMSVVLLGGVLGFSALGTLLGGITASLKGKEVLLPILLYPLLVPLIMSAVQLSGAVLDGIPLADHGGWLNLLAACDAVFLIVSYLVFDYVMES